MRHDHEGPVILPVAGGARLILRGVFLAACIVMPTWAAYAFSRRLRLSRTAAERWLITGLLSFFFAYLAWYAVSLFRHFDRGWAPIATLAVSGLILTTSRLRGLSAELRLHLRRLTECLMPKPGSLLYLYPVLVAVSFALFVSTCHVLAYPTWSWDCVWYHLAQTRYIIQERSVLYWVPTHIGYINGYPRLVEATSAFATVLLDCELLDDASQFGWALIGALAVAAWSRRFGTARSIALGLGLAWILCPAVFLQVHTTHADIAAGAQFIGLSYFIFARRFNARALVLTCVSAALLLATKISGLLLVSLMVPVFVIRALPRVARRRPLRVCLWHLGLISTAVVIGLTQPVHNMLREGNPFYPARVTIPFTHLTLPGTIEEGQVAAGRAFFADPGSFKHLLVAWTAKPGVPFPDIRERPFGLTFLYLTLPLFTLSLLLGPFAGHPQVWALLYMGLVALTVPAAWWGRFVLGVPAAALIGSGVFLQFLGRRCRSVQLLALAALGIFAVWDLVLHCEGYRQTPSLAFFADRAMNEERLRSEMRWMFLWREIQLRDAELRAGDVWAYDEGVQFLGEHWNREVTSRAVFVSSSVPPENYLAAIRAAKAKWVSVRPQSAAESVLRERLGAQLVAQHRFGSTRVYRIP